MLRLGPVCPGSSGLVGGTCLEIDWMLSMMGGHRMRTPFFAAMLTMFTMGAPAQECCDPAGPFRKGEAYADQPATCKTIADWIERAPAYDGRITMTTQGPLSAVETDGTLAYLVMCEAPGVQVLCVTYSTNGMQPGDVVLFAGGYSRVDETRVMLDPCLARAE
ncbi:hypothetical protein SAMN05216176_101425 [Nitratireductor indicus]|nr:hypothetical protein SAMN05216176_101425 [Nitratireductor indicus]